MEILAKFAHDALCYHFSDMEFFASQENVRFPFPLLTHAMRCFFIYIVK